jgi:hypothetical protein
MAISENEMRRLEELWNEKEFPIEDYGTDEEGRLIVTMFGDWKHEHGRLDYVMEKEGYTAVDEDIEDNGSDCYRSTHTFVKTVK